jgi:DNA-binding transcriptional regulator YhcF (GntR family)
MEDAEARFLLAADAILGDYYRDGIASVWVVALTLGVDPGTLSRTYDALIKSGCIESTAVASNFKLNDKSRERVRELIAAGYKLPTEAEATRLRRIAELEAELAALRDER